MADLAQLERALVKADAAGDADAARAFASEIRKMRGSAPAEPKPETSLLQDIGQFKRQATGNIGAGLVRGAGSIGATILAPIDMAKDAMDGKGLSLESNRQRRADMDAGLREMGADTNSFGYGAGKLAGEIAGTAGAGSATANALSFAPKLATAVRSGGFALQPGGSAVSNALMRILGGGISGGVSAGMVDPEYAPTGAVVGAALPTASRVAGSVGGVVADKLHAGANKLMQSAVKPTIREHKTGDAAIAIQELLDRGINPNAAGVNKLRGLIDGINDDIATRIGNSTATVDKRNVLDVLTDVEGRFGTQVSPTGDLNAIRAVGEDFMQHPSFPGNSLSVQDAQRLKQGTYKVLSEKYGQMGSAEVEAQKGLARGLKDEISLAVPEIAGLNAQEAKLLTTLKVTERRALMELNKNPMGLAALTTDPRAWAAFMADRSALFKSLAARMLNSGVNAAQSAAPRLEAPVNQLMIRSAPVAVASGE
jgi:hypothetical protein